MANHWFRFKEFTVYHDRCAHKVGTDGVLLGAWTKAGSPEHILDIGSGSGVISLMLAQRFPGAKVTGIELDQASYEQSLENIQNSPFRDYIQILQGDFITKALPGKFDLIVSNPPFFKNAMLSGKSERDKARHEFSLPHLPMLEKCASLLHDKGSIAFILPLDESRHLIHESSSLGLHPFRQTIVSNKPSVSPRRMLVQLVKDHQNIMSNELFIRNEKGAFSKDYKGLTSDFYLDF